MKSFVVAAVILTACAGIMQASDWQLPSCRHITGTGAVTFTGDDGAKLEPSTVPLHGIGYTFGLAALETPNRLLAQHNGTILRSDDAGCSWIALGDYRVPLLTFASAPGDKVFAWGENTRNLTRIAANGHASSLTVPKIPGILGLGVDPAREDHLRVGGADGTIWDSIDGAHTWKLIGTLPAGGVLRIVYRFAFDPHNLNHIVAGLATEGSYVTTNGGRTWTKSSGLSSSHGKVNVFNIVISPVDASIVWAMGIDLTQLDNGAPGEGRHIYVSRDGGKVFTPVIAQNSRVTLINGPLMAAHPADSNILYFVFGTYFQNYGTDLFKYDLLTHRLTKTHNQFHGISSIVFSPVDPSLMYLGLISEEGIVWAKPQRH